MARYKLQLKRLDFVSVVDSPAQEPATCLLIKRHGAGHEISATAKFVKASLGLAFFWAFKSTDANGDAYHDLQGDQVTADDEMVKAAMEFMERGAAVDQQHDRDEIGKVIFAMPMTPEIAKAYGVTTKQSGLMVALKPSPDVMKKLQDGTYTGVSIEGTGVREEIKQKRSPLSLRKQVVITSESDGHQHAIDLDDPADYCGDRLSTTYATSEGADTQHAHVWTFDPTSGEVTIAMDSGHDHSVDQSVPATVLAAFAINERAEDAQNASALLETVLDGGAGASAVNVTIAARNSTPARALKHAANTPEGNMPTEQEKQIVDLTKRAEHAEKLATLTDAQRAHFGKLAGTDALAFLAKSFDERNAVLSDIEKANEVVYTTKDGRVFRKSDDTRMVDMAKQLDAQATEIAKRDEAIEKQEIAKIAKATLAGLAGADEVHAYIVKSIRKGGGDAAMIESALATLKSGSSFAADASKAKGFNPGGVDDVSPQKRWDAEVAKVASEKSLSIAKATEQFATTEVGKQLYAEIQKAKQANA